jgi:hypothetical protein
MCIQLVLLLMAGLLAVVEAYNNVPEKTNTAPAPSFRFHPLPNHQMLRQRLNAFRAVRTRFVETDEAREVRFTPETHICCDRTFMAM